MQRLALLGMAVGLALQSSPAWACSYLYPIIAEQRPATEVLPLVRIEQALFIAFDAVEEGELQTISRIASFRLLVLEGAGDLMVGQTIELIAPDSLSQPGCWILGYADEQGVIQGYLRHTMLDEESGFYIQQRMRSRANQSYRQRFPERGEWRQVRFSGGEPSL